MSLETLSGLPAKCPLTTKAASTAYREFMKGIEHLRGCVDYDLLFIPSVDDFLRFDVKNHCHPVHHELLKQKSSRENDEDSLHYTKARFDNGLIEAEEYETKIQELRVKEIERKMVFDKSAARAEQLAFEKQVLTNMNTIAENLSSIHNNTDAGVDSASEIERA